MRYKLERQHWRLFLVASLATSGGLHCAEPEDESHSAPAVDSQRSASHDRDAPMIAAEASELSEAGPENSAPLLESVEPVGEATSAYTARQMACVYACGAVAAAGCAAVSGVCATGTVVTVGGVAIPCIVAIAAACGAIGGAGAVCGAYCVQ